MALIICPECGNEISDRAAVCPHCGAEKRPQFGTMNFYKERPAKGWTGKTKVYVDGEWIADLRDGGSYSLMIAFGTHEITLKTSLAKTKKTVTITPQESVKAVSFGVGFYTHNINVGEKATGKVCPHCGGQTIVQTVSHRRRMGLFTAIFYTFLIVCTLGLALFLLLRRKKDAVETYAVCQSCGHRVKIS